MLWLDDRVHLPGRLQDVEAQMLEAAAIVRPYSFPEILMPMLPAECKLE